MKNLVYPLYFQEPASRRFKALADNQIIESVFDFMVEDRQVEQMINASKIKRPAMEAIIEAIEKKYPGNQAFDLEFNHRHRQILGSMIRFIMGHYDYWPGKAKKMKKGRYVKTAIVYNRK